MWSIASKDGVCAPEWYTTEDEAQERLDWLREMYPYRPGVAPNFETARVVPVELREVER